MFDAYPTHSPYRTLHLTEPYQRGLDVYAIQRALGYLWGPLASDGVLGPKTSAKIIAAQRALKIEADGLAGGLTQERIALRLAARALLDFEVAPGLTRGQLAHESSFRLGNYSVARTDGTYDAGVTQRNTAYSDPRAAFDPVDSIFLIVTNTRNYYDIYSGVGNERRRWGLAAGAWNAPAFTNFLAGVRPWAVPSENSRALIEAYIASVTAFM